MRAVCCVRRGRRTAMCPSSPRQEKLRKRIKSGRRGASALGIVADSGLLGREGWLVNHPRTKRLHHMEGLNLTRCRLRRRKALAGRQTSSRSTSSSIASPMLRNQGQDHAVKAWCRKSGSLPPYLDGSHRGRTGSWRTSTTGCRSSSERKESSTRRQRRSI